jgi:hypothetical protein
MKKVWKCDYCSHVQEQIFGMKKHEEECAFNPANKKCFSCKNIWSDNKCAEYCIKGLSLMKGEDDGNCPSWESNNEKK